MRLKDSHKHEDEVSALLQHMSSINLMHVEVVAKPTALRRQPLFMLANFSRFGFSTCSSGPRVTGAEKGSGD